MNAIRPWCAKAEYPGLQPFLFGAVEMPNTAQSHEIEAALSALALTFLPPGFKITDTRCGAIFFHEES